jgi:LPS-assembly protein
VERIRRLLLVSATFLTGTVLAAAAVAPKAQQQIFLQADEVIYDGDNAIVNAQGHVEIDDGGRILLADKVTYDQKNDKTTASGHVSLTDQKGNVSFADHVVLTDKMRDGALAGFGALIGKNGRMAATSAQRIAGNTVIAHHTAYSPCKICNQPGHRTPLWQVKSERVIYDQSQHKIRFQNATVDFFGVPLLWSPYLSMPDPTVRHASGVLMPVIGNSTTTGYFVQIPIYFALSDTNDLTIAPMTSLNRDDMLNVEYRQRWNNGGLWLQGSGTYNPNGGLGGTGPQTYGHLFGSGRIALDADNDWRAGFDIQLTSNNAYMKDFDISQLDRLVNDLFIEDESGRSRLAVTGYYFQGLRATDNSNLIPYVLPEMDYSYISPSKIAGGQLRINVNSAILGQDIGPQSQRLTQEIRWSRPFTLGDGQLWTFQADVRGDLYHVDNDGLDAADYPTVPTGSHVYTRAIPYVALDWRWPFLAEGNSGRSYLIEPVAQVVAQPSGGNLTGIPVEDARSIELDDNNLFSFDQLPGYDLVESGSRANYGFNSEAFFKGGEAQFEVGQTYRVQTDPILDSYTGETGHFSDVIGKFNIRLPHFTVSDRVAIDPHSGSVDRNEIVFSTSMGRTSFQASYVQLPPSVATGLGLQEQVNVQGNVNLFQDWQVFGAVQQDVLTGQLLNTEYGLGYQNDCFGLSLGYRRRYTSDLIQGVPPSTDLVLRFNIQTDGTTINPAKIFPDDVFNGVKR